MGWSTGDLSIQSAALYIATRICFWVGSKVAKVRKQIVNQVAQIIEQADRYGYSGNRSTMCTLESRVAYVSEHRGLSIPPILDTGL
jgi:hypothetical protein